MQVIKPTRTLAIGTGLGTGIGVIAAAIIASVFSVEGGYVNHPADPGGATNHGITEKVARANGYDGSMRALPKQFAEKVYLSQYLTYPGFDRLIPHSPAVAEKMVDAGVNAGPAQATKWLQRALNSFSRNGRDYPLLTVDGVLGPSTVSAYTSLAKVRGDIQACELVLKLLDGQQATFYMSLPTAPEFMVGWTRARIGNVPLAWCAHFPLDRNLDRKSPDWKSP